MAAKTIAWRRNGMALAARRQSASVSESLET